VELTAGLRRLATALRTAAVSGERALDRSAKGAVALVSDVVTNATSVDASDGAIVTLEVDVFACRMEQTRSTSTWTRSRSMYSQSRAT
jgi:hypothetical protein